jgi:hypothetical protein
MGYVIQVRLSSGAGVQPHPISKSIEIGIPSQGGKSKNITCQNSQSKTRGTEVDTYCGNKVI